LDVSRELAFIDANPAVADPGSTQDIVEAIAKEENR
jgi:hypothetical protein